MTTGTAAETIKVNVDGESVETSSGASILDAVLAAGVDLPHLCKDLDGPALGACRTCLVEIDGQRGLPAACHTPAADGLVVRTDTEAARARPARASSNSRLQ